MEENQNSSKSKTESVPIWKEYFATVTPFSKYAAMALFIILPFVGFYVGLHNGDVTLCQNKNSAALTASTTEKTVSKKSTPALEGEMLLGYMNNTMDVGYELRRQYSEVIAKDPNLQKGVKPTADILYRTDRDGTNRVLFSTEHLGTWGGFPPKINGLVSSSPDDRYVAFVVEGYESSQPFFLDTETGTDIFPTIKNVPQKNAVFFGGGDVLWFPMSDGTYLLVIKSHRNDMAEVGVDGIFVSRTGKPSDLKLIYKGVYDAEQGVSSEWYTTDYGKIGGDEGAISFNGFCEKCKATEILQYTYDSKKDILSHQIIDISHSTTSIPSVPSPSTLPR